MTIKGQQAPRRHYKAELAKMDAIAKAAERLAGERLDTIDALNRHLKSAQNELRGTDKLLLYAVIAALAEAAWIIILLAR